MDDDSFLTETTTATSWFAEGEGDSEVDLEEDLDEELLDEEDEEFTDFDESSQGFSESESEASGPPGGRRRGGADDSFAFAASTTTSTVFSQARGQLQLSVLPKTLPCREAERKNLHALLRDALANNTTCSIYISGVPGTGKTATVLGIVRELQEEVANKTLSDFQFIELNGMTIADPQRAYVILWWHLMGQRASAKAARLRLTDYFTGSAKKGTARPKKKCVLLVDELDLLVTRKQDVIYNLFDWATRKSSKLIIVAIANTMDLAQRMLPRVASRMGFQQIMFTSYTRDQLEQIVKARLASIDAFDSDAITWCASKIAAVSGDARRALQICRRAADIAELASERGSNPSGRVSAEHVRGAIEEIHSAPQIRLIQAATLHEKLFLCALVQELRATAAPQTTFGKVLHRHRYICNALGRDLPNCSAISSICYRLASWGLLDADPASSDLLARVSLRVPQEDVVFAMQNDPLVSELFQLIIPFLSG